MTTEKRNDEIDLIELFQKMGSGIKNMVVVFFTFLLNFLYQILLFFIRRAIFIGIVTILIVSLGVLRYKTTPQYYSSTLEAYSNAMPSLDMISYVNNINELFLDKNIEAIHNKLGFSYEDIENIKTIKAFKVIDFNKDGIPDEIDYRERYKSRDTIVSHIRFVIRAEVLNPELIPLIQEKILAYINQNKYVIELNTVRKLQLEELIDKYESEIASLDSLKKTEYFTKEDKLSTQGGQLLLLNEKETQLYHDKILSMYKQKQEFEKTLKLRLEPITIIQDFSDLTKMEVKLINYVKFYGIAGILLGILFAFVYEKFSIIQKVIKDSKTQ